MMKRCAISTLLLMTMACGQGLADSKLVEFGAGGYDLRKAQFNWSAGVVASANGQQALDITTKTGYDWPGVQLNCPDGVWDVTPYSTVEVDVKNLGTHTIAIRVRVDNPGTDGTHGCVYGDVTLDPGQASTVHVAIPRKSGLPGSVPGSEQIKGVRGVPANVGGPIGIDPAKISAVVVFIPRPDSAEHYSVTAIRAAGEYKPLMLPEGTSLFPIIDQFGQYKHAEWPGKTHSVADLEKTRIQEESDLQANPGPSSFNTYGGWAQGPQLKVTGFFRTEKVDGKWWLVDPSGQLFFSHGISSVIYNEWGTPISFRDGWFEGLPNREDPQFTHLYSHGKPYIGDYAGKESDRFWHYGYNLQRKYGDQWATRWPELAHQRLRSWGMNTFGNWVEQTATKMHHTPYVVFANTGTSSPRQLAGSSGYWGRFVDVFDPEFAAKSKKALAREIQYFQSASDPWCIGYFIDNELSWGDELSLALAALKSPADQPAKIAFIADLKARYATIEKLNDAWGTKYESWEAMQAAKDKLPDVKKAGEDLRAFAVRTAETYFRTQAEAVRELSPGHLYLGCRFMHGNTNPVAVAAAGKYCDVVSYNLYQASVESFKPSADMDKPLIIGEFHFGATDSGVWHPGLVETANQLARAKAYGQYMRGVLKHPQFVGAHWFQYVDEPATGRFFDGENYNIGFLTITDTPYPEMVRAAREIGSQMYEIRAGK